MRGSVGKPYRWKWRCVPSRVTMHLLFERQALTTVRLVVGESLARSLLQRLMSDFQRCRALWARFCSSHSCSSHSCSSHSCSSHILVIVIVMCSIAWLLDSYLLPLSLDTCWIPVTIVRVEELFENQWILRFKNEKFEIWKTWMWNENGMKRKEKKWNEMKESKRNWKFENELNKWK